MAASTWKGPIMRISVILGLLIGLFTGLLLAGHVAVSQEEPLPAPDREGHGRFRIAGHSTYPPLLLDSTTGASWILMSAADGEERRWVWEPIEMRVAPESPEQSRGRDIVRLPNGSRTPPRPGAAAKTQGFSW
jgi:hypothetical protein